MKEYSQCDYTHDVSDEDRDVDIFEVMDAEEWSCHHPAGADSEYCLFHQPVEEKDDQAVVQRFLEVVNTGYDDLGLPPQERFRFLGAEFGDFSLPLFTTLATSGQFDPAAAEYPLDLRDSRVEGELHWSQTTIRHSLLFDGAFVGGDVDFCEATIEGDFSFTDGQFSSLVRLDDVEISGSLVFDHAEFELAVTLAASAVDGAVTFDDSHVHAPEGYGERLESEGCELGDIYGPKSQIGNSLRITRAKIENNIQFTESEIGGSVECEYSYVGMSVIFNESVVGGYAQFEEIIVKNEVNFEATNIGVSAKFEGADIGGQAQFTESDIENSAYFQRADIGDSAEFDRSHIGKTAMFVEANVGLSADFHKAVIGEWAQFGEVVINNAAEFEGADIGGRAQFKWAEIGDSAEFKKADIGGEAQFEEADIGGSVLFTGGDIRDSVVFKGADIGRSADFEGADIGDSVEFEEADIGSADFEEADIGDSVEFEGADIDGRAQFEEADIGGRAQFEEADIGRSAEFKGVNISGQARFKWADIGGQVKFTESKIEKSAHFHEADIEGKAEFEEADIGEWAWFKGADIGGQAQFTESDIGELVEFENTTVVTVSLRDANFPNHATLSGNFGEAPSLTGLHVDGTLSLDLTHDTNAPAVIDMTDTTVQSLAVSDDARPLILDLADASVGRFDEQDLSDSKVLFNWSLSEMDFTQFDFTESRDAMTGINWDFHSHNQEARKALARDDVRDRAAEHGESLSDLLVGIPDLSRRLADGDILIRDGEALVAEAAKTVFTDQDLISRIVDGEFEDVDVMEFPTIKSEDVIVAGAGWTYTQDAAKAVRDLRETIETNPEFVGALESDAVADHLENVATSVAEADPDVGPEVDVAPKDQVDTDALPTEDLESALREVYADPEKFRAENNPEVWENTYLDAKVAASEQGLNEVAAEFFLREKRFTRKRHAKRIREGESIFDRGKAAFEWLSNLTMDVTTGYGERPRNVVVSSLLIVGLFTGIYRGLNALPGGGNLAEYLLFSLQNFVTFIIGTEPQGSLLIRYTTAIEAFLGAFFVALFVFTLTRSLNR